MSQACPFNKDSLDKLKYFIDLVTQEPSLVHSPELEFFKTYLLSLGATIPTPSSPKMDSDTPKATFAESKTEEVVDEPIESDVESELEFDMEGCVEPDILSDSQVMGDSSKVSTEEESDEADNKRMEAMSSFSEGNFDKAVELLNEAIILNPTSAVLFVKRGQVFLKLNKPNACIKDCTKALEHNPDSAAAYKFRGRAHMLIGNWEEAAKDLRQAGIIDFDEQIDEWLKEVTPNAQKIEQHKLKQERKKAEKELKDRADRVRKAKEAHAKASEAASEPQPAEEPFDIGGDADGSGGPGGMSDFYKLLQDPEIMAAFQDPEVSAAFQDISMNPGNFMKYQSNPKVMALISKLSGKLQGSGMGGFPGFPGGMGGGFPGGMGGGFPGGMGGGFPGAGQTKPSDDDGLD